MAIFTAIGGLIAGAIGLGTATLFGMSVGGLIGGALAFGTSLAISYLTRPKKRAYTAVQGQREYGARVPAWTLFGTGKALGHHVYYAKWGRGNKFNADVFILANGWCDGLEPEIYFYGEKHSLVSRTIIGNEAAHYGVDGFDNLISIRFYDGRPGQGPDTKLVADTADLGQNWKATSVCAGMTYVVVEREWSEEKFEKGEPEFEFILRGLREYDPRFDSTVAGGSGPQRLDDPATWVWTENPAVHRLNYQLGLRGQLSGRTIIGEGKSLGQLDLGSYFAAMNVCDTIREGKPTYQASLFVTSDDDHTEILKEFDDAMAGYGMNRRGLSGVIPGAPQIPVLDIGPDDIDMGRAKQIKRRKSAFELYNHMSGQFTSREANWNAESLDPIFVNADVAADGRARQIANDFLQVTDPDIAEYLLQIRYRQNRKGGSATVPVSRRVGLAVQEGEWITHAGTTWLITGWHCDEQFQFTLTLAETGADVYSSDGIVPGPIIISPTPPVNPSLLSTVQDFALEVGFVDGPDGFEIPALRASWTPPEDPSIVAVRFEYFEGSDPTGKTIHKWRMDDPEAGEELITSNVVPAAHHTGRATIVTVPDRLKSWTPWVTTATRTGGFHVYVPGFLDEIRAAYDKISAFAGPQARELAELLITGSLLGTEEAARAVLAEQEIRNSITNTAQHLNQSITTAYTHLVRSEIAVIDGQIVGAISRVEEMEVKLEGADLPAMASAIDAMYAQINHGTTGLTALAGQLSILDAAVGDVASSITIRAEVGASPGAGWTSYAMEFRTGSSSWSGSVGLYAHVHTNGTRRLMIDAGEFVFGDLSSGAPLINPFAYSGGRWQVNTLHVGLIQGAKLRTDYQAGTIEAWT